MIIVIPTFNEADSIEKVLERTVKAVEGDVLVIDDHSTDGTKEIVERFLRRGRTFLIERPSKLGLGTAYVEGFHWGLARGYHLFVEMDADLSHDPAILPDFRKKIEEGFDMVIGSRYVDQKIRVVGWDFRRLLLSRWGNFYIRRLTPLKHFTDVTSGFRCYTRNALERVDLNSIRSNGYAFQIEMVYRGFQAGLRIAEIPIIFYERDGGVSKMGGGDIREAFFLPFRLRLDRALKGR